jgi:crossover junction endodeoxyribonuclease RusA
LSHVALLRLSWPASPLWQNRPYHWRRKAEAVANYKREAWATALAQSIGRIQTTTPRLVFSFHPPDNRRRDLQNMPATQKAAIDGIALAMGCDDHGFRCVWPEAFGEPVKGGCVMIEVTE